MIWLCSLLGLHTAAHRRWQDVRKDIKVPIGSGEPPSVPTVSDSSGGPDGTGVEVLAGLGEPLIIPNVFDSLWDHLTARLNWQQERVEFVFSHRCGASGIQITDEDDAQSSGPLDPTRSYAGEASHACASLLLTHLAASDVCVASGVVESGLVWQSLWPGVV